MLLSSPLYFDVLPAQSSDPRDLTFGEQQTTNIFPTAAYTDDWNDVDKVLTQDLSDHALYQDFSENNSANISPSPEAAADEEGESPSGPNDAAPTIEESGVDESPVVESESPVEIEEAPAPAEEPPQDIEEQQNESPVSLFYEFSTLGNLTLKQATTLYPLAHLSMTSSTEEAAHDHVETEVTETTEETDELDTATSTDEANVVVEPLADNQAITIDELNAQHTSGVQQITLENFNAGRLEPGHFVDAMQLRLSLAAKPASDASPAPYIDVFFGNDEAMRSVGFVLLDQEVSNAINGGYYLFALPAFMPADELEDAKVVVRYHGSDEQVEGIFLDAAWLEMTTRIITHEDLEERGTAEQLTHLDAPDMSVLLSDQLNFDVTDEPVFNLRYEPQQNFLVRGFLKLIGKGSFGVSSALIIHETLGEIDVDPEVTVGADGLVTIKIPESENEKLPPGTYTIALTFDENGYEYIDTFDFQWGVLAINPHKSEYEVGETAKISIGALSPNGNTLCDANLHLYITDPSGAVSKAPVIQSGECQGNNVTDVPDFAAELLVTAAGDHELYLERLDEQGKLIGFITDTFKAVDQQQFSIERNGPTRIYPVASYEMELAVKTKDSFDGVLKERVPASFIISSTTADITQDGEWQILSWDIATLGANTDTVSYGFDAPDISPYVYVLGSAWIETGGQSSGSESAVTESTSASSSEAVASSTDTVTEQNSTSTESVSIQNNTEAVVVFAEHRQWQIASDATGSMLLMWDGANIPTGWTCVSCTGGDPFYQRFIVGSSTAGNNGGAATHTHTAVATVAVTGSAGVSNAGGGGTDVATLAHTHTLTPAVAAANNLPAYRNLVIIQNNSAGEPTSIPTGAIALFDATVPTGWTQYAAQNGSYVRGESVANRTVTGGSNTHTHALTGTLSGPTGTTNASGAGSNVARQDHTHTISSNTAAENSQPPYIEAILGKLNATTTMPDNAIAMWTDSQPSGWTNVSTTSAAFNNRFFKPAATYGTTGGATTHTPANVNGITTTAANLTNNRQTAGTSDALGTHTHSVNVTTFTAGNIIPQYRSTIFAKRAGGMPPNAPTVHELFDNEKTGSSTPEFEFTANDPYGTDTLVYQFQWDDDIDLDTSPTGDRTSDVETGCSPNCFTNTVNGGDSNPFNENERIRFKIQSALTDGTTYYYRVRAKKTVGGTYGAWSTINSFTYVSETDPSQWMQTRDDQFSDGVFSNTETFGSNSVRIVVATTTEAIVAYGEGVVTSPRYQVWGGTSWGGELSAQDVGGVVQWLRLKAGTKRDEYIMGTHDGNNDVNVQIYDGVANTWGDLLEVTATANNTSRRAFDVAYESTSGDAMIVYCSGTNAAYRVWNGTSWVGPTTITTASANNCEYITLASDPTSDEIIMVTRDTAAGATDYEALVWDGSAWANSLPLGSMTDTNNEGIAIEYEESGGDGMVVVSNGATNGFLWASWLGTEWTTPTNKGIGDDFQWGVLKRDLGTDSLALCYMDTDNDIGYVRWDGESWQAGYQELETTGNADTGRAVSCEFETTSGRDGYLMMPYSDNTNARWRAWQLTSTTTEASISTITDSWEIGTTRTGEGKILAYFHDDANTQYDFSYWNGTVWSSIQTLEGTVSVTADPRRQPIDIVSKIFQPASGTFTSPIVDFDSVPNRPTWGEVTWTATEPAGTDVTVQVLYATSSVCNVPVPNGTLPGNAAGFTADDMPVNISGLSTSTYNNLCLKVSLSAEGASVPTLDDWTISWERQPYLVQTAFRWYANRNNENPNDAWPSGATDLLQNETIPQAYSPGSGDVLRLRMLARSDNAALPTDDQAFKLQFSESASCASSTAWFDVGAVGSTTAAWRGYNNLLAFDGSTISTLLLTGADVGGTYEEENDSDTNPNSIAVGNEAEWDWVLEQNTATDGVQYCFRMVADDGAELDEYTQYPSVTTNASPVAPTLEKLFDNEQVASTTPWFEFVAEDAENDDVTYQIQVDNNYDFSSTALDRNSTTNLSEFENIVTPADKDAFTTGQTVRFKPTSALTNSTTYYWRVRAKDGNGSNTWGDWSTISSFTVNTGTAITTWYQTEEEQFDTNTLTDTETTGSDDVVITTGPTTGTTTSTVIDFDSKTTGNAWGALSWNHNVTSGSIRYRIEYLNDGEWELVPNTYLPSNSTGFTSSPVSLLGLDPQVHNQIRVRANFTFTGGTPRLLDWKVEWGNAVEQPTLISLFDNEKTGTTTPTFTFTTTDPESNDIQYEFAWSTDQTFTTGVTVATSGVSAGFTNVDTGIDTSPFFSGDTISYKRSSAFTNGTTYWWKVRGRDPAGGNAWSVWSESRSFTVDTSISVSTWFQTTDEQFETDSLNNVETTGSDSVEIASTIREAFTAYAEGTVQTPRYRIWNGSTWGDEETGTSVGGAIRFIEVGAAHSRNEYIIASQETSGRVRAQVYDGDAETTGDLQTIISAVPSATSRGFDVAYEQSSGDALVVACNGTEATYYVWNGSSWTGPTAITLSIGSNCNWIQLASDPTSDEIIMVAREATVAVGTDYEAFVWNGSAWANNTSFGVASEAADEGITVEYEESGNRAVVVVPNNAAASFTWNAWTGAAWVGAATVALQDDFENGRLARDLGSDNMVLCSIDQDGQIAYIRWNGTTNAWTTPYATVDTAGNSKVGRPFACQYETTSGRDGYIMMPYSDTGTAKYRVFDGSTFPAENAISTIQDSFEVRSTRTGDGNILALFYDDINTQYDFSYWNGTIWSTIQTLEATAITTTAPATVPLDIVSRVYPTFTTGTVYSSPIVFSEGSGLKWQQASFSNTTPGASDILYQLEYWDGDSWELIPDSALATNSTGFSTSPIDLSAVSRITYSTIRLRANLSCSGGNCPTLNDWTVTWAEGIVVSGTIKQYNQTASTTSGTVAVAVDGVLQAGKTAVISNGTWSIPNVRVFEGDIVTVFVTGASDAAEAVGVARYDGDGDITGMTMFERHLVLGSNDATSTSMTNADIGSYDFTSTEDVFFNANGSTLSMCATTGCADARLYVKSNVRYVPGGRFVTHDFINYGYFTAGSFTHEVNGSWDNNATSTMTGSTVVFAATSTTESIDSTGATVASFNNVTLGTTTGNGTWTLSSTLDVDGALTVTRGTFARGTTPITIGGTLTNGANGFWTGLGTTTFDGGTAANWSDQNGTLQKVGKVVVDGSSKVITLSSNVAAQSITIGANDTLDASVTGFDITVYANWLNQNNFVARTGEVFFAATSTGKTITTAGDSFYDLTFSGSGGGWSFTESTVNIGNDFKSNTGTVTLPTATTTVTGSFTVTSGTFGNNNGTILFDSAAAETITFAGGAFTNVANNLWFQGTGSWTVTDTNATSTNDVRVAQGTLNLPTGTFAIGGSLRDTGGTYNGGTGVVSFYSAGTEVLTAGGSSFNTVVFQGAGSWSFSDTNVTVTDNVWVNQGTLTLPTGTLSIAGSYDNNATVIPGTGTVLFNSNDAGETVDFGASSLYNVTFNHASGGWTLTEHATSTGNITLTAVGGFTVASGKNLAISGTFTNAVGGAATTWAGSTLSFTTGTQSINAKSHTGDQYGTIKVGANTDVKMWNSSSTSYTVDSTGSLYSQDHSNVNGDLYIWGTYERTTGIEYWSYGTDFDGASLSGSERQVDVRFAADAAAHFTGATLQILGTNGNETTIDRQTSGLYGVELSNSTINAEHYSFSNLNLQGLVLDDGTTINSLENGTFTLGAVAGSLITVSTTTIDANPALQIYDVTFNTSLGTSSMRTTGDGENTFLFFDDFADGSIDSGKWTKDIELGAITETGGYLRAGGGVASGNFGHTSLGSEVGYDDFLNNSVIWRSRSDTNGIGELAFRGDYGTNRGYKARFDARVGTNGQSFLETPYATWAFANGTGTCGSDSDEPTANQWYNYEVTASTSNFKFYRDNVLKRDCTDTTTTLAGEIALQNHYGSYTDFDWVAVRNFVNPEPTHGAWAAEETVGDGLYREVHTISGTAAGAQTNYVLPITVNFGAGTDSGSTMYCGSLCNGDFSDVRFASASGEPLDYWREESYVASSSAVFWVRFDSIPAAAGTTDVSVYYGNTEGFNVSVPGSVEASAYVWFRSHSGTIDGESYDNDPGAGAGDVRWDDSPLSITVSGTVYADAGVTPITSGTCDGSTAVVRVVVNGGTSYTGSCSNVDGSYSISGVTFTGDPTLTVYLDNASGAQRGSVVTRTPTGDITDMDIYANRVIVRNEDTEALTAANLAVYDFDNDTDLRFVATTAPYNLNVMAGNELFVFATSTFTPGGAVTLAGNAAANGYDGTLYLANGATFNASTTNTYTIGGRLVLESAATFSAASSTVLMNATTTGKSITATNALSLHHLTFNGSGGGWNLGANITVGGNMQVTAGTVTGTGNLTLTNGSLTGNGTLSLGAGTTTIARTNTLGGTTAWTFYNLQLGNGTNAGTTTPSFTATTTIGGRLTIAAAHVLDGNATNWDLSGTGTVFVETGTFLEDTTTVRYSGAGSNVRATTYYNLDLNAGAGSQTYTATGVGIVVSNNLSVGGTSNSTFNVTTSDPTVDVNGALTIRSNGTFSASDTALLTIAGNYTNSGTFTGNGGRVQFDGAGTSNVAAGSSSFSNVTIAAAGTVNFTSHATTTGNFRLSSVGAFTVASGQSLSVQGSFVNAVSGALTTWTGSTLRLLSNGNYSINNSTTTDQYGTLSIDGTTQIRMWGSSATSYDVDATASLYSQDHAAVDGDLYIFGAYRKTSGSDFWSYAYDFDGTALGGSSRKVDVFMASGSSVVVSGGTLAVYGVSSASTTIQNQGSGSYALTIGGSASSSLRYYEVTDINSSGLVLTGSPTIRTLSNGNLQVSQNGGTAMTVGGTVITANPARNFTLNRFALDGVGSGFNVTATGTTLSAWRFANHYGDIDGEANDVDPGGDPGYIAWDDSAALISVSGNVYSDEGVSVSGVCDGVTNNVTLRVAGITTYSTTCDAGTGYYIINSVSYGIGDSLVVYIDGETEKGANVTKEPISNITNLHIYENRVIVRHENTDPMSIADMAVWDSSDDADIPFTAVDSGADTLTLPANRKLLVWTGKSFEPNGDVTLSGGGAGGAQDGTLELQASADWLGQGTEALSVGGSMVLGAGADYVSSNGTTTFTTTGASRTIDVNEDSFHTVVFNGSGSWTFTDTILTVLGNFRVTAGTVDLPTGTSTFSGSFVKTGGSFDANAGLAVFNGVGPHTLAMGGSDLAEVVFTGGNYNMTDTNATTTESITIESGTITLPSGVLSVGGDFENLGGAVTHNTSLLAFRNATAATLLASSSDLFGVTFTGGGAYTMADDGITLLDDFIISSGAVQLASGTMAVGGSWTTTGGTFTNATTTILFNSTDTGETINPGSSSFYAVQVGAPTGGYTLSANATTTHNFTLSSASVFATQSNVVLKVLGVFSNTVGGTNTNWNGSRLALYGQNAYSINSKVSGADRYNILAIGPNSDIRMWNSSATTTSVNTTSSLYSQDHNASNGALNIYGDFHVGTSTEYWSRATDFDGANLSGSERAVTVSHAQNATTTVDGGTLNIVGASGNETTITNQGSGTFALRVSAGTFNALYYELRNMNVSGLNLSGTPTITSLSYGDFELAVNTGSLITLASSTLNANASLVITGNRFATTTAITGKNVTLSGTTPSAWTFVSHIGNLDGENFDVDGGDACGSVRWGDSACLITQQTQYRWRNDDGGVGVPNSEWYNSNWDARKSIRIDNADATTYTDPVVKVVVAYDSDMQSDFDDLRFTQDNGTTLIPYWIGSSTPSVAAEVWLKLPSLPAEGTATAYMYYYNPTATTTSSADDTFLAADDFEDGDIAEYSGQTTLFNTAATFAYDGAYGLDNAGDESSRATTGGIYRTDQAINQGETIRYWQYVDTSAGSGDETCTKFGVQTPGSANDNYAVCLEQYGVDRISLARDVVENDGSGTILASSTVTYATGWYEIEIDWKTNDDIDVALYEADGSLVTSISDNDTTYSSGGFGFTYWFHNGGWDSFSSRPTLTTEPTIRFGAEIADGGSSWNAPQNTAASFDVGDVARLRIAIENSGTAITGQQLLLEYAAMGAAPSCEAVNPNDFAAVPVQASCGTSPVCMQSSSLVTNAAATGDLLMDTIETFVAGQYREDPTNITSSMNIGQNQYTELEYAITPTSNTVDENLCFRVTNNGTEFDTYLRVARLSLQFDPIVSTITLNNGADIALVPGATTTVYATGTVTDLNGYTDLTHATTTFYRSGVSGGASCSADNNNCYISNDTRCDFVNCSGYSCTLSCRADIYFHAEATDAISSFPGEEWFAFTELEDAAGGYDFTTSLGVELSTLRAIEVQNAIAYGAVAAASDTGSSNASTTVENHGNVAINLEVEGTDMTDGESSVIPADEQKFATSTFTYGSCGLTVCSLLSSTTPVELDVELAKPTTVSPPVTDAIYWGVRVPTGTHSTPHQGVNVFTPVSP